MGCQDKFRFDCGVYGDEQIVIVGDRELQTIYAKNSLCLLHSICIVYSQLHMYAHSSSLPCLPPCEIWQNLVISAWDEIRCTFSTHFS